MSALDSVANFIEVQASTGYSSSTTSITLQSGQGSKLPATPFNLVWWNSTDYPNPANDPNVEIVRVTNISSDTITISRGQEGTSAANHNTAAKTYNLVLGITAKMISDLAAQTGNGIPVENEVVSGSGTSWTLANTPVSGSVKLYAGGIRLNPGAGNDYTISGTTITTAQSYSTGALIADYRK
jgi:hypothetical protein